MQLYTVFDILLDRGCSTYHVDYVNGGSKGLDLLYFSVSLLWDTEIHVKTHIECNTIPTQLLRI